MSRKATALKEEWFERFEWLEKKDNFVAKCKLCKCDINVSTSGLSAISKHGETRKHVKNYESTKTSRPITSFLDVTASGSKTESKEDRQGASINESELRWVCFLVEHNVALMASDHVEIIRKMCPDSNVAKSFKCGRTKATYLLRDGLSKELFRRLIERLRDENTYFSILLDESNEAGGRKFLIILVRYFDNDLQKTMTDIYRLPQLKDGKASTLEDEVCKLLSSDNLPTDRLLTIMTDSPAVMTGKASGFLKRMNDRFPHLIDLGRCSLHHVSNAVNYAVRQLGSSAEELVDALHHYFLFTSRWTSYSKVQELLEIEQHRLLRRIETRWLQLLPVIERILEQLPALRHYFAEVVPSERHDDLKIERNRVLVCMVRDKTIELDLVFLQNILPFVSRFEKTFQSAGPLIHTLHTSLTNLYKNLLTKFVKTNVISAYQKKILKTPTTESDQLPDQDIFIGSNTRILLASCDERDKELFIARVRRFYEVLAMKLREYLPLENKFLRNLQFLETGRPASAEIFVKRVTNVARKLPTVVRFEELDAIRNECRQLIVHNGPPLDATFPPDGPVEEFWHSVSLVVEDGVPKFSILSRLAKACLALPHGNSDSERGFSDVAEVLSKKRNRLDADVIEAILRTKMAMRNASKSCYNFPMDAKLLSAGRNARQQYSIHMSEKKTKIDEEEHRELNERREKDEQERKRKQKEQYDLESRAKDLAEKEKAANDLLNSYQQTMVELRSEREKLQLDQLNAAPKRRKLNE